MKKFLLLILVLALTLSTFVACSKTEDETPEDTTAPVVTEGTTAGEEETSGEDETTEGEDVLPEPTTLEEAIAYVHQLYKDMAEKTPNSYDLVKSVLIGDVVCTVNWTIEGTDKVTIVDKDDNKVTVVIPEAGSEDVAYTLKASITLDGQTETKEYAHVVPKFKIFTFAEYAAAADDEILTIEGIVSGVFSKTTGSAANGLYIQDANNEGGYYVYNLADDPHGVIEVGMSVQVTGAKDLYNGTYELVSASVKVLNDGAKTEIVPVDYTEILANAAALNDAALVEKQGMLVTVNGVTVGEPGDNGYYYFMLGNHKTYLRISSSNNATTSEALETIKANFAANKGNTATVTGIISVYNGNFYLSPVSADAFANFVEPERSDAEKAEFELGSITVDKQLSSDKVITLPTVGSKYDNVTITWESNSEFAVVDGANVTITIPDAATEITLTATAVCGSETKTATFTIKLSKTLTSVSDAIAMGAAKEHNTYTEDKYLVGGIITEVYNAQYGNMYITDEQGNVLTIYGTYSADGSTRYDAMENAPVAGDYVVILGVIGQYNGTAQIKNGWIVSSTTSTSVKDAIDLGAAQEHNTYTADKHIVTGVITEIASTQYGNLYIEDAEGNKLYIYGLYNSTGTVRFDALDAQPKVGDTITVLSAIGQYNGTPQLKNAWIVSITKGTSENPDCTEHVDADGDKKCDTCGADVPGTDDPVDPPKPADPTPDSTLTIAEVLALGASKEHNTYTEGKYYVTGVITEVYNTTYGNMKITDADGNILTIYGTYDATGENRYDAMANAPVAGDTVTVYGIVGQYSGTAQVKNGWITAHTPAAPEVPECTEHVDSDGDEKCDTCGADVPASTPEVPEVKDTLTIPEAIALGESKEHNTYTEEKYYITATVKDVYNATYGNMHIVDAEGNELTVYGTYSADGSAKYSEMESKPVAGDTIKVYGVIGQYNGTPQMKNAWIIEFTHEHNYADATCTAPKTCACGATDGEANGHSYADGACTVCGNADPDAPSTGEAVQIAVFEFGANGSAKHVDGQEIGASKTYTNNGYDLAITNASKAYGDPAGASYDAAGNSCLKLGTSSKVGTITFTVADNVDYVIIKVAKYKSNTTIVDVNGSQTTLTKNSNDGEYDEIRVDTSTNKTVVFTTVSGGVRCMIDSIAFFG